jgi:hypothetical protein
LPDLIKICQELQNALTREAEALEGRKTIHPGPATKSIQHECTLELVGIKRGSTRLEFDLAKPQPALVPDMDFGVEVVRELTGTIKSIGNGNRKSIEPGVLQALYGLGSILQTKRVSSIEISMPRRGHTPAHKAVFDRRVVERVAARLSSPREAVIQIDGTLDMADFKDKDLKCRIDPPVDASIMCSFDANQADLVYSLMRKPVRLSGLATFQPYTDRIESVRIRQLEPLPALFMSERNFFTGQTIEELARCQEVKPIQNVAVLSGGFPTDEDVDEFIEEIYSARK